MDQRRRGPECYATVMNEVGANLPELDAVDRRILSEVSERKTTFRGSRSGIPGIIDSQNDVGGWPQLKNGTPYLDQDHDGIADTWEKTHGLNPLTPLMPVDGTIASEPIWISSWMNGSAIQRNTSAR